MNELVVADRASEWRRLKALVLDSVSSPITRRVYNLGLDEFIAWFTEEPRPAGFTKATVTAWRVALEARGLGPISINVRITAVRKLAVEAADNGLLAPELASGIARIKGVRSHGVRVGNWLSLRQAQALLNAPDVRTKKGLRDRAMFATLLGCGLRRSELATRERIKKIASVLAFRFLFWHTVGRCQSSGDIEAGQSQPKTSFSYGSSSQRILR